MENFMEFYNLALMAVLWFLIVVACVFIRDVTILITPEETCIETGTTEEVEITDTIHQSSV